MTRSPSYLCQNQFGYCFRIRVPQDLQNLIGKMELKFSLQTGCLSQARSKAMILGGRFKQMFRWMKNQKAIGNMKDAELQEIVDVFMSYMSDADLAGTIGEVINSKEIAPEQLRDMINKAKDATLKYAYYAQSGEGMEDIESVLDDLLQLPGIFDHPPKKGSPEYRTVCRRISESMKAKWETYQRYHTERLAGAYGAVNDGFQVEPKEPDQSSVPLAQLIMDFEKQKVESKKWTKGTVRNHKPKMNAMLQVFGSDKPVNEITIQDAREYAKILEKLPPSFALKGYDNLAGVTSKQLEGKHKQALDVSTRREYLNLARSLFEYALENEYVEKNPIILGLIPPKKENVRDQRLPFDTADLKLIFSAETFLKWSRSNPSRFFISLLALFTGSRLEEMANLHCEDVFQYEGLWCIEHNFNNGRKLKNRNAVRTIPLHQLLVDDFKFPQYVDSVRSEGHERVFPELTLAHGKYSHNWGKTFSSYLRNKANIKDRKKTFHSFRHTVTNHQFNKMVTETAIEELRGGAGKTEGSVRYFKGYCADVLYKECILKLDYPIDLSHLKTSKFVPK